jgi:hypothetical protein
MKTSVGIALLNKLQARSLGPTWSVAIGNGGSDPSLGVPVAPSLGDTALRSQIYKSRLVDEIADIQPPQTAFPETEFRNTFYARNVVPTGTAVTFVDEFGVFATDPDTGLDVLIDRVTFDREPFNVPASGRSVSRDAIQITLDLGMQ